MSNLSEELRRRGETAESIRRYWINRIESQLRFGSAMLDRIPELGEGARRALDTAHGIAARAIDRVGTEDLPKATADAEAALSPLHATAKEFTVYCVGHAHIDMNWMWGWQETVATTNDTFTTVVKLLSEYPSFIFGQSQASVYRILERYNPGLLDRVRLLVHDGRIEVTASHWVECDKNMVSGESLCRHLLYTREYMRELFDLAPEEVPIDWAPDTFGHARTVPSYLVRGGVRYVYMHRPGSAGSQPRPGAFRWRGPDGGEVLVRNDMHLGYNGVIDPEVVSTTLLRMFDELGLSFNLFVYGVGDHGGGPTRRDLERLSDMAEWPVFPRLQPAKSLEFFRRLEDESDALPILDEELNFEFTGCYTTQSLVKKANAYGQRKMLEAEAASVFASLIDGRAYPYSGLRAHWRDTLFHHFHDILPGSGVRDTRTYTHGLYQEAMAFTGITTTEALRGIAAKIDTSDGPGPVDLPTAPMQPRAMGAGIGKGAVDGGISDYSFGSGLSAPVFVAFNLTAGSRNVIARPTIWDQPHPASGAYEAVTANGATVRCQILESGTYWGHSYQTLAFPISVDGYGYRRFRIRPSEDASESTTGVGALSDSAPREDRDVQSVSQLGIHHVCSYALYERGPEGLSNEYLDVLIDTTHGGIRSLVHKPTGTEVVRSAESVLEYVVERARRMSAWEIEHHGRIEKPRVSAIRRLEQGPYVASIGVDVEIASSKFTVVYRLEATDPRLYIDISGIWFERGGPTIGTPTLRFSLPLSLSDASGRYEIPFGAIRRSMPYGEEVPALRWADVAGTVDDRQMGVLVANDSKHGYSLSDSTLRLTLLRSSFEPDPLPEIDEHRIRIALQPYDGTAAVPQAMAVASEVTEPVVLIQTDDHSGPLGGSGDLLRVSGDAVVSCLKLAESAEGIVVRLFNPAKEEVVAGIALGSQLNARIAGARAVDLLEREVESETVEVTADRVNVRLAGHAIETVRILLR